MSNNWLALAQIDGKLQKIRSSGSLCEGADDFSLWYWNDAPREVRREKPYSYPDDPDMATYVGLRVQTELPGVDSAPMGQVTLASRLPACLDWLDRHAELASIRSPALVAMIMRRRIAEANRVA